MGALIPAIGTVFAGAAAGPFAGTGLASLAAGGTAAAGAGAAAAGAGFFAAGGLGTALVGSVLSGVGGALAAKEESRERERQQIAEEQRTQATYQGSGEATKFWKRGTPTQTAMQQTNYYKPDPMAPKAVKPVGTQPQAAGQQFRKPAPEKTKTYQYDPMAGQVVYK